MRIHVLILSLFLTWQFVANAQKNNDSKEITETVSNYIEGWYSGDSIRMEKSLYSGLAKRGIIPSKDGNDIQVANASYSQMIHWTGAKPNLMKDNKVIKSELKIIILEIGKNIANVRCESPDFIDYLHLGRINNEWKIVNAIWEFKNK